MLVALTGATGFLGTAVARCLRDDGHRVRALVRASSNIDALEALGCETVVAPLSGAPTALADALQADAVAHMAGGGRAVLNATLYEQNRDTTRNVVQALMQCPPKRFVFVSSLAAFGPSPDGPAPFGGTPPEPTSHYGKSKAEAEEIVISCASDFPVTVIRPPAVYGPGDQAMLPVFQGAARGWMALPKPAHQASMIHVEDCARAIAMALTTPHGTGERFFVEDGQVRTWDQLSRAIGKAVGRPVRTVRLPIWVLRWASNAAVLRTKWTGSRLPMTPDKVTDLAQRNWICDATPIRDALGWTPKWTFEEGTIDTVRWYREQGWLP